MQLLDYVLVCSPRRFKNGHGKQAKYYAQRYRLRTDPPRKVRSVSLRTNDKAIARRRVCEYVEEKVRQLTMSRDPQFRTQQGNIGDVLSEYIDDLLAIGNTEKRANLVKSRIERVNKQAGFTVYAELDAVKVTKAIKDLQRKGQFTTTATANKYVEALRAWTRWLLLNGRWDCDPLATAPKIKGDTSNSRPEQSSHKKRSKNCFA